jgi:hypothetical protein
MGFSIKVAATTAAEPIEIRKGPWSYNSESTHLVWRGIQARFRVNSARADRAGFA